MSIIKELPCRERPREKLMHHGADALSDAELLAIFLRTGVAGKNAIDLARDLLTKAGSLQALLKCTPKELCCYPGIGLAKSTQLHACLALGRRYWHHTLSDSKHVLNERKYLHRYLLARLGDCAHETFASLLLDMHYRMIRFDCLSIGTLQEAAVYPREVVKHALSHNAAAVILVHNHPSGCVEASQADKNLTIHLKRLLSEVSVNVVDHIIVGHGSCLSFLERGWM